MPPAAQAQSPATISLPQGGQFRLSISNTDPNMIFIPGDKVTAITAPGGMLADKRLTTAGGVLFTSVATRTFTIFVETALGQTFSVVATPVKGEGRVYRLMSAEPPSRPETRKWETAQAYEKLLISLTGPKKPRFPWISSGSFAEAIVVEGADANASVTGDKNTAPMQLRLTGKVQMPNDEEFDLTGCFVTLEAWGDVSSERAIVRSRSISCKLGDDDIDQKIAGHVSFMGKNGIKGEVVMRNGQILLYAGGAGFLDGIGKGIEKASSTTVGVGATASMSAGDIGQAGLGGGVSSAAKTLSDYYIKRAEQYHPVIPIGAGNEVTLVFQDGFQLETLEEARAKAAARKKQNQPSASSTPAAMPGNTPDMLKQLQDFRVGDTVDPTTGQVVTQ
ncbi:conjugal transfer protein TraB [Salmonella enterica subsp. enterica serovar Giza]|nr:conjugal transfer protein TraB [Salmonella enterica subsp. enterica serovar Giza]